MASDRKAFETAMVAAGYNKPERGAHANSGYLYQRDEDRFVGWELRAALKGEQPVERKETRRALTEAQAGEIWRRPENYMQPLNFARAIEAAHGIGAQQDGKESGNG